jgi:PAS domain S-box-containing protein
VCFLGQRSKTNKLSYYWFITFAIFGAIAKFIETFSYGNSILDKTLYVVNCVCYISLLIGAVQSYSNFTKIKFLKNLILPLLLTPMVAYCLFGSTAFKILTLICFFIPAWIFILLIEYYFYRVVPSEKRKFIFIIYASMLFGVTAFILELFKLTYIHSVKVFALLEFISACSLFVIANLIFKYFKIIKEKKAKIYNYIPFYWRHVPLASVLVLILILGLIFSNYLEIASKKKIVKRTHSISNDIAATSSLIFEKIDQVSESLSKIPLLKYSLYTKSFDNSSIARILNSYKDSFSLSLVCILDMKGKILFYSNHPDMDFSKKKEINDANQNFLKHLQALINNNKLGKKDNYINDKTFYSSSIIDSDRYGRLGIVVIKYSLADIFTKLNDFNYAFIINEKGKVLISSGKTENIKNLWSPDSSLDEKEFLLVSEIKNKDIVSIYNEEFYVSRIFLNRENWSIVKLMPLGRINQTKFLSYLMVSSVIIIFFFIYYSINQSNKNLALALLHQDILESTKSIIIISTDLHGMIVICGAGTYSITGYDIEDLTSSDFSEIIFFNKNKRPITFNEAVNSQGETGVEWLCRRKDGTYINILIYITPQLSISGKVIGYIFSGLDITRTKNAEKALEEQFQFLQSLLDNIPVPIYYKDTQMRLIGCNKEFEKFVLHSKSEIIGTTTEYLFLDQKSILFSTKSDLQIAKDMDPISYELPITLPDKTINNIIFYKSALKNIEGKFEGIIGVLLDVTKERKMQMERDKLQSSLIQKNKLASLGELAGSIAHELNNPLSIIMGFSQVLSRNKSLDAETEKGIKNIYNAALRSQSIIKNMLEFSRTNSSDITDIDLNNVVKSTLLIVAKDFSKIGIEIIKDLTEVSIFIKLNAMQMQQVILNILLNAKDAMLSGGIITIKTKVQNCDYVLSISDTGAGISSDIISKIFDPFFTTKEIGKGTGLGLSICYSIVKNLKGEISVESVIGKGATFYIKFPIPK